MLPLQPQAAAPVIPPTHTARFIEVEEEGKDQQTPSCLTTAPEQAGRLWFTHVNTSVA